MKKQFISPQLKHELENRITALEQENKYFDEFLDSLGPQGASGIDDASGSTDRLGVTVPRYFGAQNTFIANPSNVGIGVIARMLETDETVKASLQFKSMMMLSKIGEYQHPDKKIAEFVRRFLARMTGPTWRQALEAMSSHGGYGFSVSEKINGINSDGQKVPVKIKTYHPSTICFEVDGFGEVTDNGIVQFVIQYGQYSNPNTYMPAYQYGFDVKNPFTTPNDRLLPFRMPFINNYGLVKIPRSKCIHHTSNALTSFGSPYGKMDTRSAHLLWQMKVFFMRQMGIAGKRQASPFIWGTAPHNTNRVRMTARDGSFKDLNPIEALTEILAARETDDSIVTGPKEAGYNIEAISSQTNLDQFLNVIQFCDTGIFRAFLLPELVMVTGAAGSRSLGDKHFQMVDRIAEEEASTFTQVIIDQLIRPAIDDNFGQQDEYGHFASRPQNIEERERLTNMFTNLANAGWMKAYDKVDGDYVRSTLHLPDQEESFYAEPMPNFDVTGAEKPDDEPTVMPHEKEPAGEDELKPEATK